MIAGAVTVLLLGAALAWVLAPLTARERPGDASEGGLSEARELRSRGDMLLASLKDLEDDKATDKLDESDYTELHDRLTEQAVDVMRRLDDLERDRERVEQAEHPVLPYPGPRRAGPDR